MLGYGSGARVFHAPFLTAAPECDLIGVVTRSPARRAQVAADLPGVAVLDDLSALVAAGAEAVTISTPVATHAQLVREALSLGLSVVCDKPFTLDAAQARELVALAGPGQLTVYQNRRWDSDLLTLCRMVAEDTLGEVVRFESRFERFTPAGPGPAGGGALLDLGSHLVDQALTLFGPVTSVHAELHARPDLEGREDDAFLALRHEGGVRSHLSMSLRQGAPGPRFRVTGRTGTWISDGMDGQEAALLAGRSPAVEGERWGEEPRERWGRVLRGGPAEPVRPERGRWDAFYPTFAAAVRGQGPLPVDPDDAVRALSVLDAARRSEAERRPVVPAQPPGT